MYSQIKIGSCVIMIAVVYILYSMQQGRRKAFSSLGGGGTQICKGPESAWAPLRAEVTLKTTVGCLLFRIFLKMSVFQKISHFFIKMSFGMTCLPSSFRLEVSRRSCFLSSSANASSFLLIAEKRRRAVPPFFFY